MDQKSEIRRHALEIRDNISAESRLLKDIEIAERFQSLYIYQVSQTIMFFTSFKSEVNTFFLIDCALSQGKQVIVPKVLRDEKRLILFEIKDILKDLKSGYMGILEPDFPITQSFNSNNLDIIVMPGAAFDLNKNRLGYGGGYYDRLISEITNRPKLIALAYHEQIIGKVPVETHDIRVDMIITDSAIIE
jgi:5-formyltetrahydrofolate cyclo-ligase